MTTQIAALGWKIVGTVDESDEGEVVTLGCHVRGIGYRETLAWLPSNGGDPILDVSINALGYVVTNEGIKLS